VGVGGDLRLWAERARGKIDILNKNFCLCVLNRFFKLLNQVKGSLINNFDFCEVHNNVSYVRGGQCYCTARAPDILRPN
jgi:hypothetical protein